MSAPPVYRGPFGKSQAERLLWRAGFGPRKGEAEALGKLGLAGAVHRLTNPGGEHLVGPKPHDDKGHPLAPYSAWGDDHAWWLDRMVRTSRPLVERMTLIWHDWFATSTAGVGSQKLMLEQNDLFRRRALGSFHDLLRDVTANPAMLIWLNGLQNEKGSPNENYGREMMELFTLGADRDAYTETDVREQARALTGWDNRWKRGVGEYDFHFDSSRHDTGTKRVFGKKGDFDWRDAVDLCVAHPKHPSFFVQKLWSYFVPTPPDHGTQASLEAVYRDGHQVKPVVAAILSHPTLYLGPRLMKPPIVHTAGLLRRLGMGITTTDWAWIGDLCGQQLFHPPNVAGWDDTRWLDTATFRGRWYAVQRMLRDQTLDPQKAREPYDAKQLVARAVSFWDDPPLSEGTVYQLETFAKRALGDAGNESWKQQQYPVLVQNALRQLVAMSPDLQTA